MKNVINNLRVPIEPGEDEEQALQRAKEQLKLSDSDLEKYIIHFIKIPEQRFNFRDMGRVR